MSGVSSASSTVKKSGDPEPKASKEAVAPPPDGVAVEGEDTMKNLRKTFAGIFGDLQ